MYSNMTVLRWAKEMIHGFVTVLIGMRITWRHLWKKPITMHYPDEKWKTPEAFRGLLKCDTDACIVCDLCVKACPVDCITIEWMREPGKAGKTATRFEIDYQKCLYCGLCVDPCPVTCIWHSDEYENASYTRQALVIDWCMPERRILYPKATRKQDKAAKKAAAPAAPVSPAPGDPPKTA